MIGHIFRESTSLGAVKLHKYFFVKFVIIKKGEIVNMNISLIMILIITNLIKND